MTARWLHYIDYDGLHSYYASGGVLRLQGHFSENDSGFSAFANWLEKNTKGLHAILVDLPDEAFEYKSIPFVRGTDRKALIRRKLTQNFFGTPYSCVLSLGRDPAKRSNERVLFTAATRPQSIEPWLKVFRAYEVSVTALYIPPLLINKIVRALPSTETRGLIVTLSTSGIRQIYFDEGVLRFSRLSHPPANPDFSRWGAECVEEAQKTQQYLGTLRWVPRGSALPVWVIAHKNQSDALAEELFAQNTTGLTFQLLSIESLATAIGVKEPLPDSDSRPLFMHLALRQRGGVQLAPAEDRRFFDLWRLRLRLLAAGVLMLLCCATIATKLHLDSRALRYNTLLASKSADFEMNQYRQLIGSLPTMPAPLRVLHEAAQSMKLLSDSRQSPQSALQALSQGLDTFPDIELDRLDWQVRSLPEVFVQENDTPAKEDSSVTQELLIKAHLPEGAVRDLQASSAYIQQFVSFLRQRPNVEISLIQQPFDASSDKTLRSSAGEGALKSDFQVRMLFLAGEAK